MVTTSKSFLLHHDLGGSRGFSWTTLWQIKFFRKCSFDKFYFTCELHWYWAVILTNMTINKWFLFPLVSIVFTFVLLCLSNLSTSMSFFFSSFLFSRSFCGGKKKTWCKKVAYLLSAHTHTMSTRWCETNSALCVLYMVTDMYLMIHLNFFVLDRVESLRDLYSIIYNNSYYYYWITTDQNPPLMVTLIIKYSL